MQPRKTRNALLVTLAATLVLGACTVSSDSEETESDVITLAEQGSFQAGGQTVEGADGTTLHCGHGFVDYQIPVDAKQVGLFMWHSSSAHVWQNRWDGGDGYQSIWLKRGYPVYLWDGPWVGRANWGCEGHDYRPYFGQDQRNFTAWRFGAKPGEWFDNVQFPKGDQEAYDQAMSARYMEFDTPDNPALQAAAAAKAIDRIGPVVAVTNSAGGLRAMLAATQTDNLKGIVAYETPSFVFPQGQGPEGEIGIPSIEVPMEDFMKLTKIPIQIVWGDNTEGTDWEANVVNARKFADIVNDNGGNAEVVMLADAGLEGNTHIPFADLNNVAVADELAKFLKKNGLD